MTTESTPKTHAQPKWEQDARTQITAALKRFQRPLADLAARDANEGDTRLVITDVLCDVLGYDKYVNLTTEFVVRGEFADYGVKIDDSLVAFIEAKRISTKLSAKHLRQIEMYAVNEGVQWMVLTNGRVWQVYHLDGGLPVSIDLVLEIDLLAEIPIREKVDAMFYLHHASLKREQIKTLWTIRKATTPQMIVAALLTDETLTTTRRELRKLTGHTTTNETLAQLIRESVVRESIL